MSDWGDDERIRRTRELAIHRDRGARAMRGDVKRPSPQLVAEWYAKLRASGFRDIEDGVRPGKLAWTFRGGDDAGAIVQWSSLARRMGLGRDEGRYEFEPKQTLADHPTAVYHRELEHAARALKGSPRKLMLAASNEGAAAGARDQKMSRRTASYQVRKFAIATGLLREAHGS